MFIVRVLDGNMVLGVCAVNTEEEAQRLSAWVEKRTAAKQMRLTVEIVALDLVEGVKQTVREWIEEWSDV